MITQHRLKEVLRYDEISGNFFWIAPTSARARTDTPAGGKLSDGYWGIRIDGRLYRAHRLAWLYCYGEMPLKGLDHIDQNPRNNRIVNLRLSDQMLNMTNTKVRSDNTSGVTGVTWDAKRQRWVAKIKIAYRTIHLGRYVDKDAAIAARKAAER